MIEELDIVALTESLPEHNLAVDEEGTIVLVYGDHEAYEVEFMEGDTWYTKALVTLKPDKVRLTGKASPVPQTVTAD